MNWMHAAEDAAPAGIIAQNGQMGCVAPAGKPWLHWIKQSIEAAGCTPEATVNMSEHLSALDCASITSMTRTGNS